jgi:hypothetical protein
MTPVRSYVQLVRRLALSDRWVAALLLAMAAWQIPQEFVGQYDPLFAANDMPFSGAASHAMPLFFLVFSCCTGLCYFWRPASRRHIRIAAAATTFLALAYYVTWRQRPLWALHDEDKITWLLTGAYATLPIASASIALIIWRYVQWRLDRMNEVRS